MKSALSIYYLSMSLTRARTHTHTHTHTLLGLRFRSNFSSFFGGISASTGRSFCSKGKIFFFGNLSFLTVSPYIPSNQKKSLFSYLTQKQLILTFSNLLFPLPSLSFILSRSLFPIINPVNKHYSNLRLRRFLSPNTPSVPLYLVWNSRWHRSDSYLFISSLRAHLPLSSFVFFQSFAFSFK